MFSGAAATAASDEFVSCFTVVKASWKGRYTRIFAVGRRRLATLHPRTLLQVTNSWEYDAARSGAAGVAAPATAAAVQLVDVVPDAQSATTFRVVARRAGKLDTMTFDCATAAERAELLTDVLRYRTAASAATTSAAAAASAQPYLGVFAARKYRSCSTYNVADAHGTSPGSSGSDDGRGGATQTADEHTQPLLLCVTTYSVQQQVQYGAGGRGDDDGGGGRRRAAVVGEYTFAHIKGITTLVGDAYANCVVLAYGATMKMHMYMLDDAARFVQLVREAAQRNVGMPPYRAMHALTPSQFAADRLGVRRDTLAAVAEFAVTRYTTRQPCHLCARSHMTATAAPTSSTARVPVARLLSTTPVALVERDAATYNVVSVYFLRNVAYLVRCDEYSSNNNNNNNGDDDAVTATAGDAQDFWLVLLEPYRVKRYRAVQRDTLLAHVLDACRGAGNERVHVLPRLPDRGKRFCPLWSTHGASELEGTLLQHLAQLSRTSAATTTTNSSSSSSAAPLSSSSLSRDDVVAYFNANVDYYTGLCASENKDGLFAENRERLIYDALCAVLQYCNDVLSGNNSSSSGGSDGGGADVLVSLFGALRRLTVSRIGFSAVAVVPSLVRVVSACAVRALLPPSSSSLSAQEQQQQQELQQQRGSVAVVHAVVCFLHTLMAAHHDHYEAAHESLNKNRLLDAHGFVHALLVQLRDCVAREAASLVVQALLEFFVYALCPPYSETTDAATFRRVVAQLLDVVGVQLVQLLHHPCHGIHIAAAQLLRVVLEEGTVEQRRLLQRAALTECGLLVEFYVAAFGVADAAVHDNNSSNDDNADGATLPLSSSSAAAATAHEVPQYALMRDLARRLLACWAYDNADVQDVLRRMLPVTLLHALQSRDTPPPHAQTRQQAGRAVAPMTSTYRDARSAGGWSSLLPLQHYTFTLRNDDDGSSSTTAAAATAATTTTTMARMRVRDVQVHTSLNWDMLFYELARDHARADLLWNATTRRELRSGIARELERYRRDRAIAAAAATTTATTTTAAATTQSVASAPAVAWNYREFEVVYGSLADELRVGQHYPRLLFESVSSSASGRRVDVARIVDYDAHDDNDGSSSNNDNTATSSTRPLIARPREFFADLYHAFLLALCAQRDGVGSGGGGNSNNGNNGNSAATASTSATAGAHDALRRQCECLHGMTLLYVYYADDVGVFADLPVMVRLLRDTRHAMLRDRLLLLLASALRVRGNAKVLLDADGVAVLMQLVTLAHLHIDRPQLRVMTNAIEYAGRLADMQAQAKEWYYVARKDDATTPHKSEDGDAEHGKPSAADTNKKDDDDKQGSSGSSVSSSSRGGNAAEDKVVAGPVSFAELKALYARGRVRDTTMVWAQGMTGGWRALHAVPQLRWGVAAAAANAPALLSFTEVTCTVLDMLLRLCTLYPSREPAAASAAAATTTTTTTATTRTAATDKEDGGDEVVLLPLPRVLRVLSSSAVLPHLVQLLLTFDSAVCSRVCRLLCDVMRDNVAVTRLYLTGMFVFAFMYTASDVLPLCRLLYATHRQQACAHDAFSDDEHNNSSGSSSSSRRYHALVRSSVLAPLLPAAMIGYLVHRGPEAFARVLLGDYDTPETIWSSAMRQHLAGCMAAHVAEYTPRLLGNNTLVYTYCPPTPVHYAALQHEFFCGDYYLRHLCDTRRFATWPLRDAVQLLRDVLDAWHDAQATRHSSTRLTRQMRARCLRELELTTSPRDDDDSNDKGDDGKGDTPRVDVATIRRAYFALAARYHPDKNPHGRDRFERVQAAYTHLVASEAEASSSSSARDDGDRRRDAYAQRVALLLQTQCILYKRCTDVLRAYTYAGYALLCACMREELTTAAVLRESSPSLMVDAAALCELTVCAATRNADALHDIDGGVALLVDVAMRSVEQLTAQSSDAQVHVCVAAHCVRALARGAVLDSVVADVCVEPTLSRLASVLVRGVAAAAATPQLARACLLACVALCRGGSDDNEGDDNDTSGSGGAAAARGNRLRVRARLTHAGVLWHALHLLFGYDATLQRVGADGVVLQEEQHAQLLANTLAELSLDALASLAGLPSPLQLPLLPHTTTTPPTLPRNAPVYALLQRLLTPYIVRCLERTHDTSLQQQQHQHEGSSDTQQSASATRATQVLRLLNGNVATPYMLWHNATRAELAELVGVYTSRYRDAPPCAAATTSAADDDTNDDDDKDSNSRNDDDRADSLFDEPAASFVYTAHKHELVVGDVFVRVYVAQPDAVLDDARGFGDALLTYIAKRCRAHNAADERRDDESSGGAAATTASLHMALTALHTLATAYMDDVAALSARHMGDVYIPLLLHMSQPRRECDDDDDDRVQRQHREATEVLVLLSAMSLLTRLLSGARVCLDAFAHTDTAIAGLVAVLCYTRVLTHDNNDNGNDSKAAEQQTRRGDVVSAALTLTHAALASREVVTRCVQCGVYVVLLRRLLDPVTAAECAAAATTTTTTTVSSCTAASSTAAVREGSCACLSLLLRDALVGAVVQLRSVAFVPRALLDAVAEGNATLACQLLQQTSQRTPEMVWTAARRARSVAALQRGSAVVAQRLRRAAMSSSSSSLPMWSAADDEAAMRDAREDDHHGHDDKDDDEAALLCVGGVYLQLYLQHPGWAVRDPRAFLCALLDRILDEATRVTMAVAVPGGGDGEGNVTTAAAAADDRRNDNDTTPRLGIMQLCTDCGVRLLGCSAMALRDAAASLGYTSQLVALLTRSASVLAQQTPPSRPAHEAGEATSRDAVVTVHIAVVHVTLCWLHELCASPACVDALSQVQPHGLVAAFVTLLPCCRSELPLLLDTLARLFANVASRRGSLMRDAVQHHVPQQLLHLLEQCTRATSNDGDGGGGSGSDVNVAALRALIVRVLTTMTSVHDAVYGAALDDELARSALWRRYKDQSHELFLPTTSSPSTLSVMGGGGGGVARTAALVDRTAAAAAREHTPLLTLTADAAAASSSSSLTYSNDATRAAADAAMPPPLPP